MASNRVKYLRGNRQIPETNLFVTADAYIDSWSKRKPFVQSSIRLIEQGRDGANVYLTCVEAESLIAALTTALTDLVREEDKMLERIDDVADLVEEN